MRFDAGLEVALKNNSAYINRNVTRKTGYHSHYFIEIAYVADGSGTHVINGTTYNVSKGDIFLINYDTTHEFVAGDTPILLYNCIFTPNYFDSALKESRNFFDITDRFLLSDIYTNMPKNYIHVAATGSENNHVFNIYERLLQEFTEKQIGYRDIMRGYVIELLVIICRLKLCVNSNKTQKMLEVLAYINENYKNTLKIEELAETSGYSSSHFRRTFKELTGKTLKQYIQVLRIEEACKLLKDREKNVEEIAFEIGYSDIKYFYSVFKKISGKLPKDFR